MIHAMSVKKANKGKKEKEESCSDQVDENMKNTDQMLRIKISLIFKFVFFSATCLVTMLDLLPIEPVQSTNLRNKVFSKIEHYP